MSFLRRAGQRFGVTKNIDLLLEESSRKGGLAKTLTGKDLVILGVAGIIGAGIFVLIGQGIQLGGVLVIPAFILAALICVVAGYAYAELASSIPASGSAYAYIYTAMGELPGWLVAWALILEYMVGAIGVAIGWRNNFLALINQFKDTDPSTDIFSDPERPWLFWFTRSPFEKAEVTMPDGSIEVLHGIVNIPSVLIVLAVVLLLVRGTKESARFTFVLVTIKVSILILAIIGGFVAFDAANFDDPFPHDLADDPNTAAEGDALSVPDVTGFLGISQTIFAVAAIMFFAYIGFDSVSTTAEETKNPKKDMPKGILGSLAITTILYIIAALALSSAAHWSQFQGNSVEASNARGEPFGYVFEKEGFLEFGGFAYGALLIRIGALVGITSVLIVLLIGGVRVFFNMSRDGLLPGVFQRLSKRQTPAFGTLFYGILTMFFAAVLTLGQAINMVNIGTLFAFLMVILAVWVFRNRRPDVERPFRMPMWNLVKTRNGGMAFPLLPVLGMIGCAALIASLDGFTLKASIGWMGLGLIVFSLYSIRHSKEAHARHGAPFAVEPVAMTTGVGPSADLAPDPKGVGTAHAATGRKPAAPRGPRAPAPVGTGGAYTHKDYTLYRRDVETKSGGTRSLYFFAKATPKSGVPSTLPAGYHVGVNKQTGLPFLTTKGK